MKMPRFFIVLGACALLWSACLAYETVMNACLAGPLPVMRADPWAGDPEEPGFARNIPFEEDEPYTRIEVPYETSATVRPPMAAPNLWQRMLRLAMLGWTR